jgi:organic radical activating enzyme
LPGSQDHLATKKKLAEVSPCLCLAKWQQVTIYLQNGHTHSCHHPASHRVPESEIATHPDALHNSTFKMERRKEMLQGKRPSECDYCWKIEDISPTLMSDRMLKSAEAWAMPEFDKIKSNPWDWRVSPTYVEVSFSSTCNFKCAYCNPNSSTKWLEEIRELGPYPTSGNYNNLEHLRSERKLPIPESEHNPYVEAFWKWWPQLYETLKVFRITGGEPLLNKNTWAVFEHIEKYPKKDLDFAVNSNLGVPSKLIEQFVEKLSSITTKQKVRHFSIFTSVDTFGPQASYIRYGMDFEQYWKNVRRVLSGIENSQLVFMCTFNALSMPNIERLFREVLELKKEFGKNPVSGSPRVILDLPYLRSPAFLSTKILPPEFGQNLENCLKIVEDNLESGYFNEMERNKIQRLIQWFSDPVDPDWLSRNRSDFYRFIQTYDERRKTDFGKTFPELSQFLKLCHAEARMDVIQQKR